MKTFKRIAVVGTGAIGGYYGARLARAGADVHFLARSEFDTLRENGLTVKLPDETFRIHPLQVYGRAEQIGPCDLVIVGLKATANDALAQIIPPLLHASTVLLTLENGLGSDELLAAQFGPERVVGGLCFICVNRIGGGTVWCLQPGSLSLAEFGRPATERLHALTALFQTAGVRTSAAENLEEVRWKKLVWNIPFNGLSIAAGGITTDQILASPSLEAEARALMLEVIAAAEKFGHRIPVEFADRQIAVTRPMGSYKPSSLIDFLEGREIEVEAIWGEPLRRARALGAEMPRLSFLYALLRSLNEHRRR